MKLRKYLVVSLFIFTVFVVLPSSISAKDKWLEVRSKNFYLIGNASEKDIRKVATKLEQFREVFRQLFSTNQNSAIPTNVVVFKSGSAYKPFKPKRAGGKIDDQIAGYFQPGEDVNYITLSTEGEDADTFGTIFHEYVHFVLNTNFGKSEIPPWFNEGLAEYYQTFTIQEDQKVRLGLAPFSHVRLLQENQLIPFETFFSISHYALRENANHSKSIFYAQSWALIHYLTHSGKADSLIKFLQYTMQNRPFEKAFQDAFQVTHAQMEKELRKYVARNTYPGTLVTFKSKLVFDNEMQVSELSEADTNAYLGDLLYHIHRMDDAEPYLRTALNLKPDLSMANTTLGMVKLRQRKYDEAKSFLEKAISHNQKNHIALYRYAYLLSREGQDEFGYISSSSFSAERSAKMREALKKAIAINPAFTESYELLAFVSLISGEELDEAVSLLKTALKYQPGNQRYAIRIAEIYSRQKKFTEAAAIADKIARTTDDPEVKQRAEQLSASMKQIQEVYAQNEAEQKRYEERMAELKKRGGQPVIIQRTTEKIPFSEELTKAEEETTIRSINEVLRKPLEGEEQILGRIMKISCNGKVIVYSVKAGAETLSLTSKDFQGLTLNSFAPNVQNIEMGCDSNFSDILKVLTFRKSTNPKSPHQGELIAIEFVPTGFRFVDVSQPAMNSGQFTTTLESGDMGEQRRVAMLQAIKAAMRPVQPGEKRGQGFIEKSECSGKGIFLYFKTESQIIKVSNPSPQTLEIRAFTGELSEVQFGCGMKQLDIPVVFTYREKTDAKSKTAGDLVSLEFMPKSFVLD